jgi:starch-binding outer membrane protein, SusD/RagB family
MNMKLLTAGLVLLGASSCQKSFLELTPQTGVSVANFFITEDDFTKAVTGTYRPLQGLYGDAYVMGEMRSDNTYYLFNTANRGGQIVEKENINTFTDVATNAYIYNKYTNNYSGIAKANAVLQRIDAANISASGKSNLKGQAEFLRAFYYFDLVQYFGGVPLHLKEVSTVEETALPRSTAADVYKQIIADATDAAALLPKTQTVKGQATQGSAKMMLGYMYMTLKQYADAEKVLKDVTTLGYSLLPDYASVFDPANKNSAESVFEVQYLQGTQGVQSNFAYQFAPGVTDTKNITGQVGNSQNIGDWNIPTADLIAAYEPGDKRKAASIADSYVNPAGTTVAQPFVKKYLHPHAQFNNTNDNWPVYRYADALLLLAESLNEQGKSAEAVPYVNQVRARAGLAATTATTQAALRDAIAKERRVELAFENHRWLDLVRTGQAIPVMTAYGARQKAIRPYLTGNVYNVTQDKLIFAIPQNELLINGLLTQNPGY